MCKVMPHKNLDATTKDCKDPTCHSEDQRAQVLQLRSGAAKSYFLFLFFKDYRLMIYVPTQGKMKFALPKARTMKV